jgi:C4-dicarboxylate transporter DctQ subunit
MIQNIGVMDIRSNFLSRWLLYLPVLLAFLLCAVQFARFLVTGHSLYKGITADQEGL